MDAAILEAASAAWASLSAIAVIMLGIVTFAGGRARPPGGLAFAAFAVLWGLHVITGRWMAYVAPEAGAQAHLFYLALLLPIPYLLVQFARAFARNGPSSKAWRIATALSVAIAIACIGLMLLAPAALYGGSLAVGQRAFPDWGPLYPWLVVTPFYASLALALATLDRARRTASTGRTAMRLGIMTGGLALPLAFSASNNATFYGIDVALGGSMDSALYYTVLFTLLTAGAVALALRATWQARREASRPLRRAAMVVALCSAAALVWGAAEAALAYGLLPRFNSVGLWRLAGVAMLAYAFARWRMPDLAPRSRQTAATAMGIGAATAAGGLGVGLFILVTPSTPVILLAGLGIPLATLSPSVRLARRALSVRRDTDTSEATLGGRLETYRAALEASLARNSLREDAGFLAALREKLAIGEDVHEALLVIARDTVLPPPDETHPGYERLRLLGEGGQGRAWLARRRADDELIVIKEPREQDDESRRALVKQARISQRVRHANLVHIHHAVHGPRTSFLVMEHMPGGSLADGLAHGPLSPRLATQATLDVLGGLAALHRAGLAHGDIKPSNVLLDADGRARLCDYGLTRPSSPDHTLTFAPMAGSLAAMAPEQLEGGAPSPSADLYATGALLYRLLTGEHYVSLTGMDELRARTQVRLGDPQLPHPRVPLALETVIRRALAKRPADRHASASAMREALEEAAASLQL